MAKHALIIGGTGQIGRAIAAELLDAGWQVTISARGRRAQPDDLTRLGARLMTIDRDQPGALAKAVGEGADAVIDVVAFDEAHARQLLEIQDAVGQFVVVSSSGVYRDHSGRSLDDAEVRGFPELPDPISETQPIVEPGPATYATRKAALERTLLDHSRKPVTILRPGAVHGTHSTHPREYWLVRRMQDGRPFIPLAFNGESRFHTSAAANIAALAKAVLDQPASRVLNVADPQAPSAFEIATLIAAHMNYRGEIIRLGANADPEIGRSPWSVPGPFVLDMRAAEALGYRPITTYAEAVGPICGWLARQEPSGWREAFPVLAAYPWPLFDYAAEDRARP
ncbi:NAD(P)H-binding protein [Terrihabitans sp. B22-R8]|uniref:NAD(P)H-binding protein n=1 Tax=Terrihabitans sp. B22-R8 TaxID=3425128 RepID=UPI00403C3CF1